MNRRRFLTLGAASAAAMVLDPDLLLWVPGRKAIFDLGPSPVQHVMYGDWIPQMIDQAVKQYDADVERFLFTRMGGGNGASILGGTIVATAAQRRDPSWARMEQALTRRAVRDLDAAARHRLVQG